MRAATWDADYANSRFWFDGTEYSTVASFFTAMGVTFTRSGSIANFVGSDGLWQKTPANDTPRLHFTGDATPLGRGLLVEQTESNDCLQSEDFATTWSVINCDIPATNKSDPGGNSTADEIAATSTADQQVAVHQDFTGLTANRYTAHACFLKAGVNATFAQLAWDDGGAGDDGAFCNFNLSTGAKGTVTAFAAGSAVNARITPYKDDWYRCELVARVAVGTTARLTIGIVDRIDAAGFEAADLADNDSIFAWGAQLEIGASGVVYNSTYIKTTTVAVTRATEVCISTFADTPNIPFKGWSTTAGTLYSEWFMEGVIEEYPFMFADADNDENEAIFFKNLFRDPSPGDSQFRMHTAGGSSLAATTNTAVGNALEKVAASWIADDITVSVSGGAVVADAQTRAVPTPTRMFIGSYVTSSNQLTGPMARQAYWAEQVSDADLVTLST